MSKDKKRSPLIGAWDSGRTDSSERVKDQAWFWTPEWQAGEAEADAQIAAGETTFYESEEAFLESLADANFTDIDEWEDKVDIVAEAEAQAARDEQLRARAKVMTSVVKMYLKDDPEPNCEEVRALLHPWLQSKGIMIVWDEEYQVEEGEYA